MTHKVNVKMIQFGVNSNKTTTGHKLQGVTLNRMVVRSWNYGTPNWIYILMSIVQTSKGLFICEKFNDIIFFGYPRLIQGEVRLRTKEKELIVFFGE